MGDGYDRFENEGNGGGSFVMGLLTGTVLGAGLGMLFAPKAGSELRNRISEQAGALANTASDGYRKATEAAGEWAERGKDVYGTAREAVAKGADEAQRYIRDASAGMSEGTPAAGASSGSNVSGSSFTSAPSGSNPNVSSYSTESVRGGGTGRTGGSSGSGGSRI